MSFNDTENFPCFYCNENIPPLRAPKGQMIRERIEMIGPLKERVSIHTRCAKNFIQKNQSYKIDKYILSSSADYPIRPEAMPVQRTVVMHFTAEQHSRLLDLASWMGMTEEQYLHYCAAKGIMSPGRNWSLENDRRVTPADKAKAIAVPTSISDPNKRGNALRAVKGIITSTKDND